MFAEKCRVLDRWLIILLIEWLTGWFIKDMNIFFTKKPLRHLRESLWSRICLPPIFFQSPKYYWIQSKIVRDGCNALILFQWHRVYPDIQCNDVRTTETCKLLPRTLDKKWHGHKFYEVEISIPLVLPAFHESKIWHSQSQYTIYDWRK